MDKRMIFAAIFLTLAGMASRAPAQTIDGKAPLVCAVNETYDCAPNRQCIADSPEAVNIPRLIRFDFSAKKGFSRQTNGDERASPISAIQIHEGKLILQGVEGGYVWSMAVSQTSGAMSLTISDDAVGVVVFGICMGE